MKTLLIFFFLAFGTAAFANHGKQMPPPNTTEKHVSPGVTKQEAAEARPQEVKEKSSQQKEKDRTINCTSVEGSRFNLSAYFVKVVNNTNLKLVELFLTK